MDVATLLGGDYNLDNVVNSADYYIFHQSWMEGIENALFTDGDGNGDGSVNSGDFSSFMSGVNLQSLSVLGDLDSDFDVDQADIDAWINGVPGADLDLDDDSDIDMDDLDLMFAQYGLELEAVG